MPWFVGAGIVSAWPQSVLELIREQLKDTPAKSDRQIAKALGVSDKTVGVQRAELESIAEIPQCPRETSDGRTYPAQRQAPAAQREEDSGGLRHVSQIIDSMGRLPNAHAKPQTAEPTQPRAKA